MALVTRKNSLLLICTALCLLAYTSKYGRGEDDHDLGAAEVIGDESVAAAGGEDEEGQEADEVLTKALECFDDKSIYSSCGEEYRVSKEGEVKVPRECVDEYCEGPCRQETNLLLHCIQQIFQNFRFYNKATLNDVRQTINAACSYGPTRGDFNVADHVRIDRDFATKLMSSYTYAALPLLLFIMGMGYWHGIY